MQVLPRFTPHDVVNGIPCNSVLAGQLNLRGGTFIEPPQDVPHLRLCDSGTVMTLPAARSILCNPIRDVIRVGSDKEMGGVHAKPIITVVADPHVFRDRPVRQEPRVAMRGPESMVGGGV